MKTRYVPKTLEAKLGWLVEECGEVLASVGKTLRHGLRSYNPELSPDKAELNGEWILRELSDLRAAIELAETAICKGLDREAMAPPLDWRKLLEDLVEEDSVHSYRYRDAALRAAVAALRFCWVCSRKLHGNFHRVGLVDGHEVVVHADCAKREGLEIVEGKHLKGME